MSIKGDLAKPEEPELNRTLKLIEAHSHSKVLCLYQSSVWDCYQSAMVYARRCHPSHTANATLELLTQKFVDRVISRKTDNPWSAHSPDLNPRDFFLWGYSKDNVYAANPWTPQELKTAITRCIRAIPEQSQQTCARELLETL